MIGAKMETQSKTLAFGLLLAAFMAAWVLLTADPAHAATTFTVNSTADRGDQNPGDSSCFTGVVLVIGGECTLRAAIQEANQVSGADTIAFNIPGSGVHTISPGSQLPTITQQVTIDGYTQGDATANTADDATENTLTQPGQTNAVLKIELHGAGVTNYCHGLNVAANNVVISGLVINNFEFCGSANSSSAPGIRLSGTGHRIEGNFIGTNADGTGSDRNARGVSLNGANNSTIGGTSPAARNLISGNVRSGVEVFNGSGNTIQGNLIGPDKNGNALVDSNAVDGGVVISSGTGNHISRNSIFFNGDLGIDLGNNGVTANDLKDPDAGANRLQNYPVITSAQLIPDPISGSSVFIGGRLNSLPSTRLTTRSFIIQFFSSPAADPSGYGEGKTFLGQILVSTNRNGNASFTFTPARAVPEGAFVTATATNKATGDTSEFSNAKRVEEPVIAG
jgi:trimeric autotransporter adhesin